MITLWQKLFLCHIKKKKKEMCRGVFKPSFYNSGEGQLKEWN